MLSAYGTIAVVVEAMKRGAIDFIPKDKDFEDLVVIKLDRFIHDTSLIIDRERSIGGLYETVFSEEPQRKGKALETLIAALFSSVDSNSQFGKCAAKSTLRTNQLTYQSGLKGLFSAP